MINENIGIFINAKKTIILSFGLASIWIIFENIKQIKAQNEISQMDLATLFNGTSIVETNLFGSILSTKTQSVLGPYLSTAFGWVKFGWQKM